MADKQYRPPSSDSDSDVPPSPRVLRPLISEAASQSSDIGESSQPLTPSCETSLQSFHFAKPERRPKYGKRKSKFYGNRWTKKPQISSPSGHFSIPSEPFSSPSDIEEPESLPMTKILTTAARKLSFETPEKPQFHDTSLFIGKSELSDKSARIPVGNCVIGFEVLQSMFDCMLCGKCSTPGMRILDSGMRAGCAQYVLLFCSSCEWMKYFWTVSGRFRQKIQVSEDKQIVKRNTMVYTSVLGSRLMGVGLTKLGIYNALLNIPSPCTRTNFARAQREVILVAEKVAADSMDRARDELRIFHGTDPTKSYVETVVSFDGAYQMRSGKMGGGFSRYCYGAAISVHTSKVVSYGIASNSCKLCTEKLNAKRSGTLSEEAYLEWKSIHEAVCTAEYSKYASVQMESVLAPAVVTQALERGVVFSGIVTDGDNKTHESLRKADLYQHLGIDSIDHFECNSHVGKRLKINICKRQDSEMKSVRSKRAGAKEFYATEMHLDPAAVTKKLSSFKGKLKKDSRVRKSWGTGESEAIRTVSEAMAAQIASYYRLAIKRNQGDIDAILKSIDAIPLHLGANDDNADEFHRLCPLGADSWCRYQAALSKQEETPHHPSFLGTEAVQLIQSVFHDFGYNSREFVKRIQDGRTSNNNEAIHSILWTMVPKNQPASFENMQLGSALAVIRYNDGWNGVLKVCDILGIPTSGYLSDTFISLDNLRIMRSGRLDTDIQKRFLKKQNRPKVIRQQLEKYGEGYVSGKFSGAQAKSSDSEHESPPASPILSVSLPIEPRKSSRTPKPSSKAKPTSSTPKPTSVTAKPTSVIAKPTSSIAKPVSSAGEDYCEICGGTEANGLVGLGIQKQLRPDEIQWIMCDICGSWFHDECLGIDLTDMDLEEPYFCPDC